MRHRPASVTVIVDADTATRGPRQGSVCQTETGHDIPVESVDRLCCDAVVRRVTLDEAGVPVNVGRRHRTAADARAAAAVAAAAAAAAAATINRIVGPAAAGRQWSHAAGEGHPPRHPAAWVVGEEGGRTCAVYGSDDRPLPVCRQARARLARSCWLPTRESGDHSNVWGAGGWGLRFYCQLGH